jgi:hypothetical protein
VTVAELKALLDERGAPDDAVVMLLVEGRDGYVEVKCTGVAGVATREGRTVVSLTTR